MSSHFSANQYEGAFRSNSLGNWEVPATYKSRPVTLKGTTQTIANNAGHLKECVPRSSANPWGNFIGTWEMPQKIAGNQARVPTGRTSYAQQKLTEESKSAECVLSGATKNQSRVDRLGYSAAKRDTPRGRVVDVPVTGGDKEHDLDIDIQLKRSPLPFSPLPVAMEKAAMTPPPVALTPPSASSHSARKSPMGVGKVGTPPLPVRTPETPKSAASFRSEERVPSAQRLISPMTPDLCQDANNDL